MWKVSKYRFFSGPYYPIFSPNAEKHGLEKTPYLDTFHAVKVYVNVKPHRFFDRHIWQCCMLGFTNHNYSEIGLHCWLIKAWESCSCMCCFKMCCCQVSTRETNIYQRLTNRRQNSFLSTNPVKWSNLLKQLVYSYLKKKRTKSKHRPPS